MLLLHIRGKQTYKCNDRSDVLPIDLEFLKSYNIIYDKQDQQGKAALNEHSHWITNFAYSIICMLLKWHPAHPEEYNEWTDKSQNKFTFGHNFFKF
jgi:hypothetical protein